MAATQPQPNIWSQMSYSPPRGPCSQKPSMLSTCACYRFMIHPLKAASSFDCDGCGHHASFHRMENKDEEEIARRWKSEAGLRERMEEGGYVRVEEIVEEEVLGPPKRRRIAGVGGGGREVFDFVGGEGERSVGAGRKRKAKGEGH